MAATMSSTEYPMPVPKLNTEYCPCPYKKRAVKEERDRELG